MDYEEFMVIVAEAGDLDQVGAERAARATLQTLAERLSKGEARDLLEQSPAELKPLLYREGDAEAFDVDEFLRRVGEREGADVDTAERHARAVFYALGRALTADETADLAADLPQDFDPLVAEAQGRRVEIMPAEEIVLRVAEQAGIDIEPAGRLIDAVLETLAERVAGGEVDDMISRLPVELHPPLKRGKAAAPTAERISLDDFAERLARRAGTDPLTARDQARAVFAVLREALGTEDFSDVVAQLPGEYAVLLPPP
jgi:uncharacterized protein (DUF2267 family)